MKTFDFYIIISGKGKTLDKAWADARENADPMVMPIEDCDSIRFIDDTDLTNEENSNRSGDLLGWNPIGQRWEEGNWCPECGRSLGNSTYCAPCQMGPQ